MVWSLLCKEALTLHAESTIAICGAQSSDKVSNVDSLSDLENCESKEKE